jgi:hypothetical protein
MGQMGQDHCKCQLITRATRNPCLTLPCFVIEHDSRAWWSLQDIQDTIDGTVDASRATQQLLQINEARSYVAKYNEMRTQCTSGDSSSPGLLDQADGQVSWNFGPPLEQCQVGCA